MAKISLTARAFASRITCSCLLILNANGTFTMTQPFSGFGKVCPRNFDRRTGNTWISQGIAHDRRAANPAMATDAHAHGQSALSTLPRKALGNSPVPTTHSSKRRTQGCRRHALAASRTGTATASGFGCSAWRPRWASSRALPPARWRWRRKSGSAAGSGLASAPRRRWRLARWEPWKLRCHMWPWIRPTSENQCRPGRPNGPENPACVGGGRTKTGAWLQRGFVHQHVRTSLGFCSFVRRPIVST